MDEWTLIPGYPNYQIKRNGEIRKIHPPSKGNHSTQVTLTVGGSGRYLGAKLKDKDGVWKRAHVHVLVMLTFVGPRPAGMVINHLDGNKLNNDLANLEYCTQRDNERHSLRVLNKKHLRGLDGRFISKNSTAYLV